MPAELKAVVVFNGIATVVITVLACAFGGGFDPGVYPPDEGIEIKMVRIESESSEPQPGAAPRPERLDIPSEYRPVDLSPRSWVILPDGSVRFDGADQR